MALLRRRALNNVDLGQAFRDNIQQFVLTDVTPTGRILGTGSFGGNLHNITLFPPPPPPPNNLASEPQGASSMAVADPEIVERG